MNKEVITIPKLAELLGISRVAVFKKVKKGEILAENIGRVYVVPIKSVSLALGKTISKDRKDKIEIAVKKAVKEYGDALKLLGNE
jgi:hypothetical protein